MGESFKAVCSLIMIVATIVAAFAWFDDQPNQTTWIVRVSSPLIAVLSLVVLLKVHWRRDLAPDYLQLATGTYFNRDGFCFAFALEAVAETCHLHAYYQNQYELPCIGRIALRPARGFFLTRGKLETITFEIACEGGAFGVATLPIPLPQSVQGKRQTFEVGASASFPNGKGRRIRFRDGIFLRANTNFGNSFGAALTVAGALGGAIVLSTPASVTLSLPAGVREELADGSQPQVKTIWKPGDRLIEGQ